MKQDPIEQAIEALENILWRHNERVQAIINVEPEALVDDSIGIIAREALTALRQHQKIKRDRRDYGTHSRQNKGRKLK